MQRQQAGSGQAATGSTQERGAAHDHTDSTFFYMNLRADEHGGVDTRIALTPGGNLMQNIANMSVPVKYDGAKNVVALNLSQGSERWTCQLSYQQPSSFANSLSNGVACVHVAVPVDSDVVLHMDTVVARVAAQYSAVPAADDPHLVIVNYDMYLGKVLQVLLNPTPTGEDRQFLDRLWLLQLPNHPKFQDFRCASGNEACFAYTTYMALVTSLQRWCVAQKCRLTVLVHAPQCSKTIHTVIARICGGCDITGSRLGLN